MNRVPEVSGVIEPQVAVEPGVVLVSIERAIAEQGPRIAMSLAGPGLVGRRPASEGVV